MPAEMCDETIMARLIISVATKHQTTCHGLKRRLTPGWAMALLPELSRPWPRAPCSSPPVCSRRHRPSDRMHALHCTTARSLARWIAGSFARSLAGRSLLRRSSITHSLNSIYISVRISSYLLDLDNALLLLFVSTPLP